MRRSARDDHAREALRRELEAARQLVLRLVHGLTDAEARAHHVADLSPLSWHLGHVAWQEEWWALRRGAGQAPVDPSLDRIYDSFRSDKGGRGRTLPPLDEIHGYVAEVRRRTCDLLASVPLEGPVFGGGLVFRFLANHERQHAETMVAARLAARIPLELPPCEAPPGARDPAGWCHFLPVDGGPFRLGADDDPDGWDNERGEHEVVLAPFAIARQPVTNGAWLAFVEADGYGDDRLWSEAGRRWRDEAGATEPLHWRRGPHGWERWTLRGWHQVELDHPVAHVGHHEAEAFARWAGARLPAEAEWERAAGWEGEGRRRWPWGDAAAACANVELAHGDTVPCTRGAPSPVGAEGMGGDVWEWTGSPFLPWPGFTPGLYAGYSAPWFGAAHRVLRGGSWATARAIARTTFRNWLEPHVRVFPSGLRLARNR